MALIINKAIISNRLISLVKFNRIDTRLASTGNQQPNTTCLYNFHKKRQARMEPFAGYLMPIVYKDQSIKSEHLQCRDLAAAFDVSHMMQTIIRGEDRVKFIEGLTVADIESMTLNKCTLSVFTNQSGGIIDDCIVGKCENHLQIVSNAGNAELVWSWLNSQLEGKSIDVQLERLVGRGLIALQGPKAANVLQSMVDVDLSKIEFMNTFSANLTGIGLCQFTRCGYTGEDGFEISVDPLKAETLMETFCNNKQEVKPAGLGARDTLRLEAGLCLHGHDISDKTTPIEAALNWTVHKRRRTVGGFLGSEIILDQLKSGSKVKRIGLKAVGGGPPAREHCKILDLDGKTELGQVTSGTFAPKLQQNIAMGYMPTEWAKNIDQSVYCNIRGKNFEYKLTKMPFIKSNYYVKTK